MNDLRVVQMAAGLALLLVLFGASFSQASAGDDLTITIHNRICPVGYAGESLFEDCHDSAPDGSMRFWFDGPISGYTMTDAAGNGYIANLVTGTYTVSGGLAPELGSSVVYCSFEDDPDSLYQVAD